VAIAFIESHVSDFLNGGEAVSREKFFPKEEFTVCSIVIRKPFMVHLSGHNEAWKGLLKAGELDSLLGDPRFATANSAATGMRKIVELLRAAYAKKIAAILAAAAGRQQHPQRADQHDT
jgi:crotonobetainyl-CoA:carnitine CoA-transferase CaiB-like acyl-CoA transferase